MKTLLTVGAALVAASLCAIPARAHAVFDKSEASPNSSWRPAIRIGHGCEGTATIRVRITIPEGVIGVKPMPKPGWTIVTTKGDYAREYKALHSVVKSGVKEIVWSGGSLPEDFYDEFVFSAQVSDAFPVGTTVYFPVLQECEKGAHDWAEIPAAGADARKLKSPAPGLRIVAAANAPTQPAVFQMGPLKVEAPWIRATPGGATVAGGFARIVNAGAAADRLVSAAIDLAGRAEIHETAMQEGVMRMRALPQGLDVPSDGAVELKPGSFHIMFLDLKAPMVEGQTVKGTLVFEKAGALPVVFRVNGLGAGASAPQHQH